jgi:hypothetical protein
LKLQWSFQTLSVVFRNSIEIFQKPWRSFNNCLKLQLSVGVLNHQSWWQLWYPHFWSFEALNFYSVSFSYFSGVGQQVIVPDIILIFGFSHLAHV